MDSSDVMALKGRSHWKIYNFISWVFGIPNYTVCAIQNGTRYLSVFSMNSWSNWTSNDNLGICLWWGFQNFHMFNLMKFWLIYLRLKTMDTNWKTNFSRTFKNQAQPWISQSILHQIQRSGSVLKSACHEDSKTSQTCSIWWSFGWDIWWLRQYN